MTIFTRKLKAYYIKYFIMGLACYLLLISTLGEWTRISADTDTSSPMVQSTSDGAMKFVFYLKTHKCASTTMQGLFTRYAIHHKLNTVHFKTVHPYPDPNMLKYIHEDFEEPVDEYHMITSHTVFFESQIRQLLPRQAKFISVVRDPLEQFKSIFHIASLCKKFRIEPCENATEVFLRNPAAYDGRSGRSYVPGYNISFTKNTMASHFGYVNDINSKRDVSDWLGYIDERFHFVGLVERMPESLVYIRRMLKWELKDILSLSLRDSKRPAKSRNDIHLRALHKRWSSVDHELYDYFQQRFDTKIDAQGEDFQLEVKYFKQVQTNVTDFCLKLCPEVIDWALAGELGRHLDDMRKVRWSVAQSEWHAEFSVTHEDCLTMMVDPDLVSRISKLRSQQCTGRLCKDYIANFIPPTALMKEKMLKFSCK